MIIKPMPLAASGWTPVFGPAAAASVPATFSITNLTVDELMWVFAGITCPTNRGPYLDYSIDNGATYSDLRNSFIASLRSSTLLSVMAMMDGLTAGLVATRSGQYQFSPTDGAGTNAQVTYYDNGGAGPINAVLLSPNDNFSNWGSTGTITVYGR